MTPHATRAPKGHDKVYPAHCESFWAEQGRLPEESKGGWREQGLRWLGVFRGVEGGTGVRIPLREGPKRVDEGSG